jgi:hypothetical protein
MSASRAEEQTGTMSRFITGSVASINVTCACGKRTVTRCHFADGGPHGVCIDCGDAELVKIADGLTTTRLVCKRCRAKHRAHIWATAIFDALAPR